MKRCPYIIEFLTLLTSLSRSSSVISEITEIYKQVRVHIGLQMHKRKFTSEKYTRRKSYAKFGTFLAPPGIISELFRLVEKIKQFNFKLYCSNDPFILLYYFN